ncbi:MAG: DsbA family protein, partial [Proteobacteria bacterium]|nr:DsbA family protein [Pseudomonadota bacterium]
KTKIISFYIYYERIKVYRVRFIFILSVSAILAFSAFFLFKNMNDESNNDQKSFIDNTKGVILNSENTKGKVLSEEDVKQIAKDFISQNPELIVKSVEEYYSTKTASAKQEQHALVNEMRNDLENNSSDPSIGEGEIVVVEFFDYSCSFCKRMHNIKSKIIDNYSNVRFVFKESPILNKWSLDASKASIAVNMIDKEKYAAFQDLLFQMSPNASIKEILQSGEKIGIDVSKMKNLMESSAVQNKINENLNLVSKLKINGMPFYIIGNDVLPGAFSYEEINAIITSMGGIRKKINPSNNNHAGSDSMQIDKEESIQDSQDL